MRLTIDKILALPICEDWRDRSLLEALAAGRKWIAPLTLARMDAVPLNDRRYVLLHLLQRTAHSERDLRLFACDCAERALQRERERRGGNLIRGRGLRWRWRGDMRRDRPNEQKPKGNSRRYGKRLLKLLAWGMPKLKNFNACWPKHRPRRYHEKIPPSMCNASSYGTGQWRYAP